MNAIADLNELRDILVEMRRSAARRGSQPDAKTEDFAARLEDAQRRIEAIDRAIADETTLAAAVKSGRANGHRQGLSALGPVGR